MRILIVAPDRHDMLYGYIARASYQVFGNDVSLLLARDMKEAVRDMYKYPEMDLVISKIGLHTELFRRSSFFPLGGYALARFISRRSPRTMIILVTSSMPPMEEKHERTKFFTKAANAGVRALVLDVFTPERWGKLLTQLFSTTLD